MTGLISRVRSDRTKETTGEAEKFFGREVVGGERERWQKRHRAGSDAIDGRHGGAERTAWENAERDTTFESG